MTLVEGEIDHLLSIIAPHVSTSTKRCWLDVQQRIIFNIYSNLDRQGILQNTYRKSLDVVLSVRSRLSGDIGWIFQLKEC